MRQHLRNELVENVETISNRSPNSSQLLMGFGVNPGINLNECGKNLIKNSIIAKKQFD